MTQVSFEDFYQVPDLKFNILKLRDDLDSILKSKNFNSLGISHFGAIPINRIPNDNESVEGHNVRGKYWTIADESGKVVSRDIAIDESKYTELMPEFENTYFKEVYETLRKKFKLGRVENAQREKTRQARTPPGHIHNRSNGGADCACTSSTENCTT